MARDEPRPGATKPKTKAVSLLIMGLRAVVLGTCTQFLIVSDGVILGTASAPYRRDVHHRHVDQRQQDPRAMPYLPARAGLRTTPAWTRSSAAAD
jgi:hypothetical protein